MDGGGLSVQDYAVIFATGAGIFLILVIGLTYLRTNALGGGGPYVLLFGFMLAGIAVITSGKFEFGDIKAEFAQSYASSSATQNAQIARLQTEVDSIRAALKDLARSSSVNSVAANRIGARIEAQTSLPPEFQRNQSYQVLVFHKPEQTVKGKALAAALLAKGFQSSATETGLTESRQQFDAGTAWLIYTEKGAAVINEVKRIISESAPGTRIAVRDSPYPLRSGDFQVLLF